MLLRDASLSAAARLGNLGMLSPGAFLDLTEA